ncbi:MFS transporter [uncultured Clostridium sp.]|uniref:MFS transporter n=1 Tax=uncultured Clostridium sp. TaxID=59620 RepID=UPI0028E1F4C9|nr:MFS transporter [uncultured Clostridium sp.]
MQLNLDSTKNFTFFIISNTISSLGDYIYDIAIVVYLYKLTGSSIVLGGFFIFQFIPTLIFTPFIGTLIDKLDKKKIIIFTNLLRALILIILLLYISTPTIFLTTLVLGICDELNRATNNAIIPQVVNTNKITKANSILSALDSSTMIVGPIIASFLMSTTEISGSIIANALSFLLAGIIMKLTKINNINVNIKKENFFYEVKRGLRVIFQDIFVKNIIIIWGLLLIGVGITGSLIVILITDYMGLPSASYGWLTAAEGAGMAIGSLIIIRNKNTSNVRLIVYGLTFLGIGTLITALSSNITLVIFAYLIIGLGASTAPVGIRSLLQTNIPKDMIGRVFTSVRFVVTSLRTLSISIFSVLAGYINLRLIFIIAAFMMFLSSFIALCVKNTLSVSETID